MDFIVSLCERRRGAKILIVGARMDGMDCPAVVLRVAIASILRLWVFVSLILVISEMEGKLVDVFE